MLSLNYDSKNDILYLTFSNKNNSIGDEIIDGYVVMKDILSDDVTGVTIFDFMKKYNASYQLPIEVNYRSDIVPSIV